MKEECKSGITIPLQKARERTAAATGVSQRSVTRINSELNALKVSEDDNKSFLTPHKTKRKKKPITGLDHFDECVVRRTVYEFYITEKRLPTSKLLQNSLKEKLNFQGSQSSVRRILKKLGFSWKRTQNNRRILIEKSEIREKRITYLQSLKRFRSEGRPIVYMDESYVCSDHVSGKMWSDGSNNVLHTPVSKGERLIIVHAGGEQGFVPNALAMWKAGQKSGDYHDNMNNKNYMQWVINQLIPNLNPNSVLVIDNAKYHNKQIDKAPTSNSKKEEMTKWLSEHNISYDPTMLKPQLYKLILQHKHRYVKYVLDDILEREGHSVLRLPPYHPDLNPIEMIWADVKNYVASHNTTFKLCDVKKLCEEKFSSISQQDWECKCRHVKNVENEYAAKEPAIDEITESFIINVDDSTSDDEGTSDSDEFSDMSGIEEL
ncbi:uncharacterized protein LOC128984729 [Macrosteles quadrilineatus]|uniref:uncharacterized protein LOC128984729 n=4 Tax=Macrosteles quadrilineatus TaxID=74068 RepID=UPI0023E31EE8|nr:uncharacterized protein LOC128984729 [Macrosteles quadrilineatus]